MSSVVKKEGGASTNFNEGQRGVRNYSRGRPRCNAPTISDFMDRTLVVLANKMSSLSCETSRRGRRRGGRNKHKPQGPRQTQIDDLNDDCLMHIFSFLPIVDKVRIQGVCKRWQSLSLQSWRTFRKLDLKEASWGVHYNKSKVTINRHAFHQVLKLCGPYLTHVDLSTDIIGRIPRIRIESCKAIIKLIEETCPNLRSLNISKPTTACAIDFIADHFYRLTELTIEVSTYKGAYDYAVECLFSSRINLKYLKLLHSKLTTACLMDANFENLEELHLEYCEFEATESILNVIDKLNSKLHTLSIIHSYGKTPWEQEVLQALGGLTNLKKLNLEMSDYFRTTVDTDFLCYLTNLEELRLRGYAVANDDVLRKISLNCRKIRKLQLLVSNSVTDIGIDHIAKLPRLEYLSFETLNQLRCENLEQLSQIKYLECLMCTQLKNEGLVNLIENSANIRWIKIRNCESADEEIIDKVNSVASEKLCVTLDNSMISTVFFNDIHSLNKVDNRIKKSFEKLCIDCCKVRQKGCTVCFNKVEVF